MSDAAISLSIATIVGNLLKIDFANGRCVSADATVKRLSSSRSLRRWSRRYEALAYPPMTPAVGAYDCISMRFSGDQRALISKFAETYAGMRLDRKGIEAGSPSSIVMLQRRPPRP